MQANLSDAGFVSADRSEEKHSGRIGPISVRGACYVSVILQAGFLKETQLREMGSDPENISGSNHAVLSGS